MQPIFPRRQFMQLAAGAAMTAAAAQDQGNRNKRKFTLSLAGGPIGVKADIPALINYAKRHGFESIEPVRNDLLAASTAALGELRAELEAKQLRWGVAGVAANIRAKTEADFASQLKALPKISKAMQTAGADRVKTYIMPRHAALTYRQNFKLHLDRVKRIAEIVGGHGIRFGLEYVGPKTLWTSSRFSFIHTMAEAQELIDAAGHDNVGLVLDSWHWYTAHETKADLLALSNHDIVSCDLNDAPAGIAIDEQIDNVRGLPATTGVIDLKTFLNALVQIGYDGPVQAEPFDAKLRALDDAEAVKKTADAMHKAFALIG